MKNSRKFYDTYKNLKHLDSRYVFKHITQDQFGRTLSKDNLTARDFLLFLSASGDKFLESMAHKAHDLTDRYFGKVIHLYTPMYLSNHCDNECSYCGFKHDNKLERKTLTIEEVRKESAYIASKGLKNILILTGGSREKAPLEYIKKCVRVLREHFSSISIEIYALTQDEYKELIDEGVDGLTIYQEVYDEDTYQKLHLKGPKKDYLFRLEAPERALASGMRMVNIGSLLGLNDWRKEVFSAGLHARYLQDKFPEAEISVSVPRVRPQVSGFEPACKVTDRNLVQIITALRVFLPRVGITLSTREGEFLRDHLLGLGVTRMSADSTTKVGGHTLTSEDIPDPEQFRISDTRSVEKIRKMLMDKGYQPVFNDWVNFWEKVKTPL